MRRLSRAIKRYRNQIWTAIFGTFVLGLSAIVPVQAAPRQRACAEIRAACEQAGFVQGGARTGDGLFVDCIAPIMRASERPRRSSKPLPQIDGRLVTECKALNPNFGQRATAPAQAIEPSGQVSPLPRAATPQPDSAGQRAAPPPKSVEPPPQASSPHPLPPANDRGIGEE